MLTAHDLLEEFNEEVSGTRKMLERIPFDKLDFKPSPTSMPLGQLAFMIARMPNWLLDIITKDFLEMSEYPMPPAPHDVRELMKEFDEHVSTVQKALTDMPDADLGKLWALKMKGQVMMELSKGVTLRQTINHWVHHRAQLGVYLKMNGVPHPAVYGPSGDEQ